MKASKAQTENEVKTLTITNCSTFKLVVSKYILGNAQIVQMQCKILLLLLLRCCAVIVHPQISPNIANFTEELYASVRSRKFGHMTHP